MPKYRPRPVIVDAYRLPDPRRGPEEAAMWSTIAVWCCAAIASDAMGHLLDLPNDSGQTIARPGEWIVKSADGFAVIGDAEFRAQFEEAV
ncbi:MAG: hypothetical protein LCH92_08170 [Proteobacteria bacterium]|nr:hypothetical protein [Pseudomonadota bacterium]